MYIKKIIICLFYEFGACCSPDGKWIWQTEDRSDIGAEAEWKTSSMELHQIEDRCVSLDVVSKKWKVTSCDSQKFVICEATAKNGMAQSPESKPILLGKSRN